MKLHLVPPVLILFALVTECGVSAPAGKPPAQSAWARVTQGPVEVYAKTSRGAKVVGRLNSGALVAAFQTKSSGGEWTQVHVISPATLQVSTGWTESARLQKFPVDQYPADAELERILGGPYLEDVNANYARIIRFLVPMGQSPPALVAYVGSQFIPSTRLQVFERENNQWTAGPYLEFMSSQMQTGVGDIEVRDLLGDGKACLITREPFSQTYGASGVNLVIRRIEADKFTTLWKAPLVLGNLTSFPARIRVLDPPEKNIGAPGTVTRGSVDYQSDGKVSAPVWKGKIEFRIPGREEPVNTVSVEKVCHWDGTRFAALN